MGTLFKGAVFKVIMQKTIRYGLKFMWSCNVAAIKILLGCKLSEAYWEVQNSVMTEKSGFSSRSKDFKKLQ